MPFKCSPSDTFLSKSQNIEGLPLFTSHYDLKIPIFKGVPSFQTFKGIFGIENAQMAPLIMFFIVNAK